MTVRELIKHLVDLDLDKEIKVQVNRSEYDTSFHPCFDSEWIISCGPISVEEDDENDSRYIIYVWE